MKFLYHTAVGRLLLRIISARWLSALIGRFLNSRLSKPLIRRFVRKNGINTDDYICSGIHSFNDFFTRKIKDGLRPASDDPRDLVSPCDANLSAYRIDDGTVIPVKQSEYTVSSLLGGDPVGEKYLGGVCLVFRLGVDNYHRYCYIDNAEKSENVFIPGVLHTVRPIALGVYPVFIRNCREYTVMETENFGTVTQIEVGALLVGKIKNLHGKAAVKRGEEKGMFLYGGSTVILLLEKNRADIPTEYFSATARGEERPVRMGMTIGKRI